MQKPESLVLPSSQTPEVGSEFQDIQYNPDQITWHQLMTYGPDQLVGVEFDMASTDPSLPDGTVETYRITSHDVVQRPIWGTSKTLLPKAHMRGQVAHGLTINKTKKHTQTTEEVDTWMVDVLDQAGDIKRVEPYYSSDKDLLPELSHLPQNWVFNREHGPDVLSRKRREEPYEVTEPIQPLTEHFNELRLALNSWTGRLKLNKKTGTLEPTEPRLVTDFYKREVPPEPDFTDAIAVPVRIKGRDVTLQEIKDQAEELGRNDLVGLTWTDGDGNIKKIVRHFNAPPTDKNGVTLEDRATVNYYMVDTYASKKDYETGETIRENPKGLVDSKTSKGNSRLSKIRKSKESLDKRRDYDLPADDTPLETELRSKFIYTDDTLQTSFNQVTQYKPNASVLGLHFRINKLEPNQRNDADILDESLEERVVSGELPHSRAHVAGWLGRRVVEGVFPTQFASEKGSITSITEALTLLNLDDPMNAKDYKETIELLKSDHREVKYAKQLEKIVDTYGKQDIIDLAFDMAERAKSALDELGIDLRYEDSLARTMLKNLVKSSYYNENPDERADDGFTLSIGNPFERNVAGNQAQRDAIDFVVGREYLSHAINRTLTRGIQNERVIDPRSGEEWTVISATDKYEELTQNYTFSKRFDRMDKSSKSEIKEFIDSVVKNKTRLSPAQIARIGRLLNRTVGN
jgi:hypothetical protein